MEVSVFFVSKPIQYFNATNIEDNNMKILFIINGFNKAEDFFNKVSALKYWHEVRFFEDFPAAFNSLADFTWHRLYLDSDYGYSKHKFLRNYGNMEVFIYEEGVGTYTNSLRKVIEGNLKLYSLKDRFRSLFLTFIYSLIGNKDYLGGHKLTRGVYVYDRAKHRASFPNFNKEIKSFKDTFVKHLHNEEVKSVLYGEDYKIEKVNVLLYLSTWVYNSKIEPYLQQFKGYRKLIKPHPYLREIPNDVKAKFDDFIKGEFLVEYLIDDLIQQCDELIIIHEGTSAMLYFDPKSFKEIIL